MLLVLMDIYFIVLDELGRADLLRDRFGPDYVARLRKAGFDVPEWTGADLPPLPDRCYTLPDRSFVDVTALVGCPLHPSAFAVQ